MSQYPFVFVHGFNNWYETMAPAKAVAEEMGLTAVAPHISPYASAWDRACELYAMLLGGTVDYGKAHAKKYHHDRYGRTYPGLLPDWGQTGPDGQLKKVNLVGHSFGGPTILLLLKLLEQGSKEERKATDASDLSPLFLGGNENWVNCIYTLASPLNGTTLVDSLGPFIRLGFFNELLEYHRASGTKDSRAEELNLDHLGFFSVTEHLPYRPVALFRYCMGRDTCYADLSCRSMKRFMKECPPVETVYYFSQPAQTTKPHLGGHLQTPLPCTPENYKLPVYFLNLFRAGKGKQWKATDGRVNTISATAPFSHPKEDYTALTSVKKGVWYVLPIHQTHHNFYIQKGIDTEDYRRFMGELIERVTALG